MQKIVLLISIVLFNSIILSAQDTIVNRNGSLLKVKIIQLSHKEIKYKNFDNSEGPLYIIPTSQVDCIRYETGNKQCFNNDIRKTKPVGLSIDIGGASLLAGLSANWFITPKINIEAGYGFGGFNTVGRYYFWREEQRNWFSYIGAGYMEAQVVFIDYVGPHYKGGYFPVGFHFISKGGFLFMGEVAYMHLESTIKVLNIPGIGCKIGYQF